MRQAKAADGLGPQRDRRNRPATREAHRPRLHVSATVLEVGGDHHVAREYIRARRSEQPFPRFVRSEDVGVRIDVALRRHRDVAFRRRIGRQHLPAIRESFLAGKLDRSESFRGVGVPNQRVQLVCERYILSGIFPPGEELARRIIGRPDPPVGPGSGLVFAMV